MHRLNSTVVYEKDRPLENLSVTHLNLLLWRFSNSYINNSHSSDSMIYDNIYLLARIYILPLLEAVIFHFFIYLLTYLIIHLFINADSKPTLFRVPNYCFKWFALIIAQSA